MRTLDSTSSVHKEMRNSDKADPTQETVKYRKNVFWLVILFRSDLKDISYKAIIIDLDQAYNFYGSSCKRREDRIELYRNKAIFKSIIERKLVLIQTIFSSISI